MVTTPGRNWPAPGTTMAVIAAHPDDEVLGCGGTMALAALRGTEVHVAFMTDGVAAREPADRIDAAERRRAAARTAQKELGAKSISFGSFPDNRIDSVDLLDLVRSVESILDELRPQVVLTHHGGDLNVDHQLLSRAVVTACRPQPGRTVETLLFFEVPSSTGWDHTPRQFNPGWHVDVSATLDAKLKALEAYSEELRPWPHARSREAVEHLARWRGASVGVEAAEAFEVARHLCR